MNGRLYDPYLQRFLSPDPFVQSPMNPQNYNRYSYVLNNPLMYTDPSGYFHGSADDQRANRAGILQWRNSWMGQSMNEFGAPAGGTGSDSDWIRNYGKFEYGIGLPGQGQNGLGFGGVYYDWYSGKYRSIIDYSTLGWERVHSDVIIPSSFSWVVGEYWWQAEGYYDHNEDFVFSRKVDEGYYLYLVSLPVNHSLSNSTRVKDILAQGVKPGFDIDKAVNYLNEHAYPKYDKATCGYCASAVRKSLEAGGVNTANRPNSAKDYGPYLKKWGFISVVRNGYSPLKGDIRVFQNYTGGSIHGHINMYNGDQWVSDFFENGFWPGRGYRENNAAFTIYRWDY